MRLIFLLLLIPAICFSQKKSEIKTSAIIGKLQGYYDKVEYDAVITARKQQLYNICALLRGSTPTPPDTTPDPADTAIFNVLYKVDYTKDRTIGAYDYNDYAAENNGGLYEWGLGERTDVFDPQSLYVVDNPLLIGAETALQVNIINGQGQTATGSGIYYNVYPDGETELNEAYISFNIGFSQDYDFKTGHVLGIMEGGRIYVSSPIGAHPDEGFNVNMAANQMDEWELANRTSLFTSAQITYANEQIARGRYAGAFRMDIYDWTRPSNYGKQEDWADENGKFIFYPQGQMYNLTFRFVNNTPGVNDGILEGYINGKLYYQNTTMKYRLLSSVWLQKFGIANFHNSTATNTRYGIVRDIVVYTYKDTYQNIARGRNPNQKYVTYPLPNWPLN